jgi:hypothetical protein
MNRRSVFSEIPKTSWFHQPYHHNYTAQELGSIFLALRGHSEAKTHRNHTNSTWNLPSINTWTGGHRVLVEMEV